MACLWIFHPMVDHHSTCSCDMDGGCCFPLSHAKQMDGEIVNPMKGDISNESLPRFLRYVVAGWIDHQWPLAGVRPPRWHRPGHGFAEQDHQRSPQGVLTMLM